MHIRSLLLIPAFLLSLTASSQGLFPSRLEKAPAVEQLDIPISELQGTAGHNRYGFHALYEVRMSPGVIKVLDIRQYYITEAQAVQAFMKVQASVPPGSILKSVQWISPTGGSGGLGD